MAVLVSIFFNEKSNLIRSGLVTLCFDILACGCNTGYSRGFGCNPNTGQCECLPGVIGDKCDRCPFRNILIPDSGCLKCSSCIHNLLDSNNDLKNIIDPIMIDFEVVILNHKYKWLK